MAKDNARNSGKKRAAAVAALVAAAALAIGGAGALQSAPSSHGPLAAKGCVSGTSPSLGGC